MRRLVKSLELSLTLLIISAIIFCGKGYWDAFRDAPQLRKHAIRLIEHELGGASLGRARLAMLLRIEDPNFAGHFGVDLSTSGASGTTITQSLSKHLRYKEFYPVVDKLQRAGFTMGLESWLSKEQILALWLGSLEMGKGLDGRMTGFHKTSFAIYDRHPADLNSKEFNRLVAVLISPGAYRLEENDPALNERVSRIERLFTGTCEQKGARDVWLEGCRALVDS
ncbi:membrane carboxypeptidase/penicillin-binding protein PbpC [Labrenzia sp. EL_142]|nr:membrane carboxypeptidase/penicillin-binding protein PbpC [Labrenzia sp. EL_142]